MRLHGGLFAERADRLQAEIGFVGEAEEVRGVDSVESSRFAVNASKVALNAVEKD